jgi:hypothetical protein
MLQVRLLRAAHDEEVPFVFHGRGAQFCTRQVAKSRLHRPSDGPGLSEGDCHHQPLVVRRRLPAPRPGVVFDTNFSVTRHPL